MVIFRYCMKLFNKSPAAYAMLKDTKLLVLQSKQRLCLERNLFKPTPGITSNVLKEICSIAGKNKALFQKNVLLVIDEMKITGRKLTWEDFLHFFVKLFYVNFQKACFIGKTLVI